MSWQPYGLSALALLVVGALILSVRILGWDAAMASGIAAGGGLGVLLMLFGLWTMRKALKETERKSALGHALGGFFLRMVAVVVGTLLFVYTGWASPVGFALSFMAMVFVYLGVEVYLVQKSLEQPKVAATQALGR